MDGSKLNQEATKQYSRSFSSIILDDFFSKNEGINGQQIIAVTPIKQINFFILKVLFEQWQEETKKFKSPFFNYKKADVNQALKNLVNTLSKNILIEREDFKPLLETAVLETLFLLFDPKSYYLSQIDKLAKNRDIRSVSKYIKIYKPLFDSIALNVEKNSELDMAKIVLQTIDNQEIDESQQSSTIALFHKILPLNILEKEANESSDTTEYTIPEISATEAFGEQEISKSLNGHDAPLDDEIKTQFKPLEKSDPSPNINDQFAEEDVRTLNEQYQAQETVAAKHETETASSLAASISINQRYLFMSDLFEENEKDYNTALKKIEKSKSFDASVEYLVQTFSKKYAWDMNSDEVKEFLKVIFKKFR